MTNVKGLKKRLPNLITKEIMAARLLRDDLVRFTLDDGTVVEALVTALREPYTEEKRAAIVRGKNGNTTTQIRLHIEALMPGEDLHCYSDKRKDHRRLKFTNHELAKVDLVQKLNKRIKVLGATAEIEHLASYGFDSRLIVRYPL